MQTRPQVTISAQAWEGYWVTLLARPWLTMTAGKRPAPRGLNRMPCRSYAMPATIARYAQVPPDTDSASPISVNPAGKPGALGGDGATRRRRQDHEQQGCGGPLHDPTVLAGDTENGI